jgi:hypothetical protein
MVTKELHIHNKGLRSPFEEIPGIQIRRIFLVWEIAA